MNEDPGQALYKKAQELIPGGTQLLSKRPEMFLPGGWPPYYSRAKGVNIWDLGGRKYTDMSYAGIGACVLGFADEDVDRRVRRTIKLGSMSTLNCPEEVELAELLMELHPWAKKVRFCRGGGEAMAVAVRLARAATGREKIAFCGYHGWHDWYLSANLSDEAALDGHLLPGLSPAGVPRSLRTTALPFAYNRMDQLEKHILNYGHQLAAIVMEPVRSNEPEKNFLLNVKRAAKKTGAVLIFDEVTSGWRLNSGGVHLLYDVHPDIAVFAKGISNGYPMAAVIGRTAVMNAAQNSFISSTYWTERIGPTAALATVRKHIDRNVGDHLKKIGGVVMAGWAEAARETGLSIQVSGIAPLAHFVFESEQHQVMKTVFTKLMLKKGFLATTAFYASYAHQLRHVQLYTEAVTDSFFSIRRAMDRGKLKKFLNGPIAHAGFFRLS